MLPHSHPKEMAGPARPAQRCRVAHIVTIHKAEFYFPCIPNSMVPTTQCLYGPVIHSGSAGLRGESRPSSERPTWSCGPRDAQLRKSSLPLNGAGISWLAIRGGALGFSQPQFPQQFGIGNMGFVLMSVRIPSYSNHHKPISSNSLISAQCPTQCLQ